MSQVDLTTQIHFWILVNMDTSLIPNPPAFSEFEKATAEQIALAKGKVEPDNDDYAIAVKKAQEWRKKRISMGLAEWI